MEISKSSVDKAGERLRQTPSDETALDTLAAWRNKHVYALGLAFNMLKKQADKVGNNATYGQRLKRVSSILDKLERLPETKLSRLQDIGGCRVILSDYDKLRDLYKALEKSRSILPSYKDYIMRPKADGYRGMHLIYKCGSKNPEYAGLKIEFQLRTKLQHAWATTVEIIDSFEGQQLKLGKGSQAWRRFFYLVADEFAISEKLAPHDNIISDKDRLAEIKQLAKILNVINKLNSYTITTRSISDRKNHDKRIKDANFFVLVLKIKEAQIEIIPFKNQIEAQIAYIDLEKAYINDSFTNVLMVKMDSIKKIKKSYPNYFADSKVFLEKLNVILNK